MQQAQSTPVEGDQSSELLGDELVQQAFEARELQDFRRARDLLLEALNYKLKGYSYSELYTILGICYKNLGQFKKAMAAHRAALRLEPGNYRAWNNVGVTLVEWEKIDEAIRAYRIAIKINPAYVFAYGSLGAALLAKKRTQEAINVLDRAAAMDAAICPPVHSSLALAHALDGNFEVARRALRYAIAFDAEDWHQTQRKIEALEDLAQDETSTRADDELPRKPLDQFRRWFSARKMKLEEDDIPF